MAKSTGQSGKKGARAKATPPQPSGQRVGARRFLRDSWGELRKVQWPTKQQVAQGTLVVAVVTVFFAAYVSAVDQVAVRIVEQLNHLLR